MLVKCTVLEGFGRFHCSCSYYWILNTDPDDVFGLTVLNVKVTKVMYLIYLSLR
jgi:hypothetical protein